MKTNLIHRLLSCLLLTLAVAPGCASAGGAATQRWQLPNGQNCYRVESDSLRIAFSELLDIRALEEAVAALPELRMPAGDTVLLSMHYDSTGARSLGSASHGKVARATLDQIETRMRELAAESGPPRRYASAILIRAEPPQVRPFVPQFACEPALMNPREVARSIEQLEHLAERALRRAMLWIRIDENGVPVELEVRQSSGRATLDAEFARVAWSARFAPAGYDGHLPVSVWVQLPLSIREAAAPPARALRP